MTGRVFKASMYVFQSDFGDACGGLRLRQQSKATSKSLEQRIYVDTQDSSFVQRVSPKFNQNRGRKHKLSAYEQVIFKSSVHPCP